MQNYVLDDFQKGIDAEADNNTCYDKPDKKQKHPHYEHRTTKMLKKNNEFSVKKFQKIRHVNNEKKLRRAFKRIARRLNHVSRDSMPRGGYDKVCLILVNTIEHHKHDPKIGAMNDGYLFGLYHHRLGFKVFYLHNCIQGNYPKYLQFFLFHTTENLTVYYSGPDACESGQHAIEFKHDKFVTAQQFGHLTARDNNGKCKVVFVSDCTTDGSVYDISQVTKLGNPNPSPMLLFHTIKSTDPSSKEGRRSHGVFTYYFCKILYDDPSISAKRIVERLNAFMNRFGHSVACESTDPAIMNDPIYDPCPHPPQDPVVEALNAESSSDSANDNSNSSDYSAEEPNSFSGEL